MTKHFLKVLCFSFKFWDLEVQDFFCLLQSCLFLGSHWFSKWIKMYLTLVLKVDWMNNKFWANPFSIKVFSVYYSLWAVIPSFDAIAFWPSMIKTSVLVRYSSKLLIYSFESELSPLCFFLAYSVSLLYSDLISYWVASTIWAYVLIWRVSTVPGKY